MSASGRLDGRDRQSTAEMREVAVRSWYQVACGCGRVMRDKDVICCPGG